MVKGQPHKILDESGS